VAREGCVEKNLAGASWRRLDSTGDPSTLPLASLVKAAARTGQEQRLRRLTRDESRNGHRSLTIGYGRRNLGTKVHAGGANRFGCSDVSRWKLL
jgi:hypothetical protein